MFRQLHPPAWPAEGLSPLNRALIALILLAAAIAILQTEPLIYRGRERLFEYVELILALVFLAEYLARVWTIVESDAGGSPLSKRLRFAATPAAIFDLLAIVVTLMPIIGLNGSVLRLVRLLRILRIGRLGRFSQAFQRLTVAILERRYEFAVTLSLAAAVLLVGASALHWLEGDLQPDKFGSVPRALWWAIITLTTIGYGDVYPITAAGKVVASLVALAGIGLIALPAGLLASSFNHVVSQSGKSAGSNER